MSTETIAPTDTVNAWADTVAPAEAEATLARLVSRAEAEAARFPGSTVEASLLAIPAAVGHNARVIVRTQVLAGAWTPAA